MNPPQGQRQDEKGLLNAVPAWGSYLYQNFLVPAFSPTTSMSEWLNLNTPFSGLTPRALGGGQLQTTQPNHQDSQDGQIQASPLDYFGSNWGVTKSTGDMTYPLSTTNNHRASEPLPPQNLNNPFALVPPTRSQTLPLVQPTQPQPQPQPAQQPMSASHADNNHQAGPSNYYANPSFYYTNSIPTSLLMNGDYPSASDSNFLNGILPTSSTIKGTSAGVSAIAAQQAFSDVAAPDQIWSHSPSPMTTAQHTPQLSPRRAAKRRCDSLDSDDHSEEHDHEHEHEHEVEMPEGVERDGMIWGMKVEDYRALSARERKRVRNRISARTFRAKRKEHLSSLEENTAARELQLRLANEESSRLRKEVADLKRRLARYENL